MLNLVFQTDSSPQILDKIQTRIFSITGFRVKLFINERCHNSRGSDDIDMKLWTLSKAILKNITKALSQEKKYSDMKKIDEDIMLLNSVVIVIFPD